MQKKRKAQEAFTAAAAPLSAFAAARAKAAKLQSPPQNEVNDKPKTKDDHWTNGHVVKEDSIPDRRVTTPAVVLHGGEPALIDDEDSQYGSDVEQSSGPSTLPIVAVQTRLSTVRPSQVTEGEDSIKIELQADQTSTFIGKYDLEVIKGSVLIQGALLRSTTKRHRIYAPSIHALPVITAKGGVAEFVAHSVSSCLPELADLSPLYSKLWNDRHEDSPTSASWPNRSFDLLYDSSGDPLRRALVPLEVNDETQQALNKIMGKTPLPGGLAPLIMITGPKGSGKSTFSRLLANTMLTAPKPHTKQSCFWLDLDPGQPEFSSPGQVSLCQLREPVLGPPLTHPFTHPSSTTRTIRAHTLAAISPRDDTDHFLSCAFDLLGHYLQLQKQFPGAPLIVNCSGWVVGSALPVLYSLIQRFPLSDLILMQPMDPDATEHLRGALAPKATLSTIPIHPRPPQTRTSAEFRAMQAMSYLHSCKPTVSQPAWDSRSLTHMAPWKVAYAGPSPGVSAILSYHEPVPPGMLSTVLNGATVAVIEIESTAALTPYISPTTSAFMVPTTINADFAPTPPNDLEDLIVHDSTSGLPFIPPTSLGLLPPLDPRHSNCQGTALIRGIDIVTKEIHLLTPIPVSSLRGKTIVLVRGKFDSPDWAFLEDVMRTSDGDQGSDDESDGDLSSACAVEGQGSGKVVQRPYVSVRAAGTGLSGSVWRVRHLPRNRWNGRSDAA